MAGRRKLFRFVLQFHARFVGTLSEGSSGRALECGLAIAERMDFTQQRSSAGRASWGMRGRDTV